MRYKLCIAAVLVLFFAVAWSVPGLALEPAWEPVGGPYGGSVAAVALSPAYPTDHAAFAGLRGHGVYRTFDGGNTWQRVSPEGWVVVALAVSPAYADDGTVFATAGLWPTGYKVYRSTDEGGSWQDVTPAWTDLPSPPGLAVSPDFANDRTLYVTGGSQTFVSTDGGDTFVQPGGWFAGHAVSAMAFSPAFALDRTLFALVPGDGLYKSTDGGATWSPAGPGLNLSAFAVSPDYAADATVLAVGEASGQLTVSHDGGATWQPVSLALTPGAQTTLAFSPTFGASDGVILAASAADPGPYRSEDGGTTWTPASWYDPAQPYNGGFRGGSVYALALAPAGSWDAAGYAGSSSGLYHSYDRGVHWWRHDDGPARLTVRALAVAPGDPNTLLAGTSFFEHVRQDNGALYEHDGGVQISYDGGQSWTDVTGRLERAQGVAFSPAFQDDGTAFAATGTLGQHGYADGGVYRSTDGGQNWEEVVADRICRALAVSPAFQSDRMVWVSESTYSSALGLFVSADGGTTWSPLAPDVHASVLAPSPNYAVDRTLFAGTPDAGLQRSADAGATWTQVLTPAVTALAISPAFGAGQTLYAGARPGPADPGELYRSTDGGDTWQRLETGIPPAGAGGALAISTLAFARDGSVLAGVYYGSEGGGGAVYRSVDGGDTWQAVGAGLEDTSVLALESAPSGSMTFYAGATGGLWQIEVPQGDPPEPGTWQGNGPRGGRALALGVSPDFATDGVAFTGEWIQHKGGGQSGLGIFKSSDQGQTWQASGTGTEHVAYASALHDFAFSPEFAGDGIVFAATWGGLFRSTDRGQDWSWVGRLYSGPFGSINDVAVAPDFATSRQVMAASGWGGLHISYDAGIHWTSMYTLPVAGPIAYSPAFGADGTAFAGGWYGLYRTLDAGATWTHVLTASMASLAVSPDMPADGTVFVGADGLYISHDAGTSWISVTLPLSPSLILALAVSPAFASDQAVFAGTNDGLFESRDGGLTWAAVAGWPGLAVRSLAISPGWPAHPVVLAGTEQGVYRTADGGASWQPAEALATLSSGPLALSPDGGLLAAGASRHGLYGSGDGGASWFPLGLQQNTWSNVYAIVFSPDYVSDHTLFASLVSQESIGASVQRTRDGGATWQQVYGSGYINSLAVSPGYASDRTVYATADGQVVRSQDGGDNWAKLGEWPAGVWGPARLVAAPPGGTVLAAGDGFWRLPPGANLWEMAASGLVTGTSVSSVALGPGSSVVLAAAAWKEPSGEELSGVWRSTDGGANWKLSSTGLPASGIGRVAWAPSGATAYAISDRSLYRSADGGVSWTTVGRPPIDSALADVVAGRDGSVYVASRSGFQAAGEGVWRYWTPARNVIVDGGFEAGSGWEFPQTAWPAGITDRVAYDGSRSARIGIDNGLNSQVAYSSARQVVAIPVGVVSATLSFRLYPASGESALLLEGQGLADGYPSDAAPGAGDAQYLLVLDAETGAVLDTLFWELSNAQRWQRYTFDLAGYAGRSIRLHWGVANDNDGGRTGMYLDDVSLVVVRQAAAGHVYLPIVLKNGP